MTTINTAMTMLIEELAAEIPDVLTESFSLAAMWNDLCRLAGEIPPRDVAAVLDAPLDLAPLPTYPVRATEGREGAR